MHEILSSFLDNESTFGRLMTRLGIIIGANLMFVLFSFPVVTMGASFAALYHVMLKTLRGDGVVNPFRQFWIGFRSNFRQATILWIAAMAMIAFLYTDMKITESMTGGIRGIRYPLIAVIVVVVILLVFAFPTMAAFADTIPHLIRNGLFFALKRPLSTLVILFFHLFPMYLTYTDPQMQPLYAFCWCFFGFGAIALLEVRLLLPEFQKYLPLVDCCGDFILDENGEKIMPGTAAAAEAEAELEGEGEEITDAKTLEEMKKLGM